MTSWGTRSKLDVQRLMFVCLASALALVGTSACSGGGASADPASAQTNNGVGRSSVPHSTADPAGATSSRTKRPTTRSTDDQQGSDHKKGRSASTGMTAKERAANKRAMKQQKTGNVHKTVAAKKVVVKKAVALRSPSSFGNGVKAQIVKRQAVKGRARLPGEVSGPAVKLTLNITNTSNKAINLDALVVDVQDAHGRSASPLLTPPARHIRGRLASGDSATGIYLFTIAKKDRSNCTVRISYTGSAPEVAFRGDLP